MDTSVQRKHSSMRAGKDADKRGSWLRLRLTASMNKDCQKVTARRRLKFKLKQSKPMNETFSKVKSKVLVLVTIKDSRKERMKVLQLDNIKVSKMVKTTHTTLEKLKASMQVTSKDFTKDTLKHSKKATTKDLQIVNPKDTIWMCSTYGQDADTATAY
jgi:hypothetical protein